MRRIWFTGVLAAALSLFITGFAQAGEWNGNTYIDEEMDYQVTLPENYENLSEDDSGRGEEENQKLHMGLPNGKEVLLVCIYDAPQIKEEDISANDWALKMKEAWECDSKVTEVEFQDCSFSKLSLPKNKRSKKNIDLYFRRTGDSIVMVEAIYADDHKEAMDKVLSTIQCPD